MHLPRYLWHNILVKNLYKLEYWKKLWCDDRDTHPVYSNLPRNTCKLASFLDLHHETVDIYPINNFLEEIWNKFSQLNKYSFIYIYMHKKIKFYFLQRKICFLSWRFTQIPFSWFEQYPNFWNIKHGWLFFCILLRNICILFCLTLLLQIKEYY